MRVYVNKRKKLILAPEVYEKYGGVSNETIQIKNGKFTAEIEKEVSEAMQEIIERWQPIFDNIPTEELFAEKQKQLRTFSDFDETLTSLVENSFNEMWTGINKMDNFKVLIVNINKNGHEELVEEFEIHKTDFETVKYIASAYIDNYCNKGCYSHIFII